MNLQSVLRCRGRSRGRRTDMYWPQPDYKTHPVLRTLMKPQMTEDDFQKLCAAVSLLTIRIDYSTIAEAMNAAFPWLTDDSLPLPGAEELLGVITGMFDTVLNWGKNPLPWEVPASGETVN